MDNELIEPTVTDVNRGFWDAAAQGRLVVQQCTPGGHLRYPLAPWCPECLSDQWDWHELSGRGTILSFVIFHQPYHPAWTDRLPYNVVIVQLEEGPRMVSNVLPLSEQDLAVGMPLTVTFDSEGDFSIPRFIKTDSTARAATQES
jgi:uncharacterized OB-fold protein